MEKFNDLILIHFQKSELPFIRCVHTYLPSLKLQEADTSLIISYLRFKNPALAVVVPKIDIHSGNMVHYHFDPGAEKITNDYGIDEPETGIVIPESEIDLVLVPMLAFDTKGYRVGYGKGYYDKFLSLCRPDVIRAGISFFDPVQKIGDINDFDIPLHFCATPHQLYVFDT
jgi:5-formyltetrahydrofolate cyclo-ligase